MKSKNDTAHQVSEEKMDKDPSDDIYEESTTYVYDGGESPIDSAIPIGDKFDNTDKMKKYRHIDL